MAKKAPEKAVAELQPDELNALKALVTEFIEKVQSIDNEIEELKGDRKQLFEDYSDKLDMKTLQLALRIIKLQNGVAHKDTFDLFIEVLTDPAQ
jgi:uncharacterized protein (UPF0335 family)